MAKFLQKEEGKGILSAVPSKQEIPAQKTDIAWGRTHLLIVNGDREARHLENARMAAKAGAANGAKSIRILGFMDGKLDSIEHKEMAPKTFHTTLKEMGKSTKEGDTVFLYITGHGGDDFFVVGNVGGVSLRLPYDLLQDWLAESLPGREIIFVSDACLSGDFINKLADSNAFKTVRAMSPGVHENTVSCSLFAEPFWNAVKTGMDLDGNGLANIEEFFYYAMENYRNELGKLTKYSKIGEKGCLDPKNIGTYRETLPHIEMKGLKGVKEGVVMVTADWCKTCRMMNPIFNQAGLLLKGEVPFYLMDLDKLSDSKKKEMGIRSVPTFLIVKNGEVISTKTGGLMDLPKLRSWMGENGVDVPELSISAKSLYEKEMFAAIVRVMPYEKFGPELGERKSLGMLLGLLSHPEEAIREKAVETLKEMCETVDVAKYPEFMEAIEGGKIRDPELVGYAASHNPGKMIPWINEMLVSGEAEDRLLGTEALIVAVGRNIMKPMVMETEFRGMGAFALVDKPWVDLGKYQKTMKLLEGLLSDEGIREAAAGVFSIMANPEREHTPEKIPMFAKYPKVVDYFVKELGGEDIYSRGAGAYFLNTIPLPDLLGRKEFMGNLAHAIAGGTYTESARYLLFEVFKNEPKKTMNVLGGMLKSPNPEIRLGAAIAVSDIYSISDMYKEYKEHGEKFPDPGREFNPVPVLIEGLRSKEREQRIKCAYAIVDSGKMGRKEALAALEKAIKVEKDEFVKERMEEAYEKLFLYG